MYRNAQYNAVGIGKIDAIKRYLNEIIFELRPRPCTTAPNSTPVPTASSSLSTTESYRDGTTTTEEKEIIDIDCQADGGGDDLKPDTKTSVRNSALINADNDDIIVLDEDEKGGVEPEAVEMAQALDGLPVPHKARSSASSSSSHRVIKRAPASSVLTPLVHDLSIDGDDDDLVDSDEENRGQNYDTSISKKRKLVKQSTQRYSQSKLTKTKDVISITDEVENEEVLLSQGDDLFFTDHTPIKAGADVRANKGGDGVGDVGGGGKKRLPLHDKNGNIDNSGADSESDNDVGEKKASPWARRRVGGRGLDLGYMRDLVHSDSDNDANDSDHDDDVVEEKIRKNEVKGDKDKKWRKGVGKDEEMEEEIDDGDDDEFELACQSKKGKKRKGKQATSSSIAAAKGGASIKAIKTNSSSSSASTSGKVKDTKGDGEQGLVSLGKKIIVFAHHQVRSVR